MSSPKTSSALPFFSSSALPCFAASDLVMDPRQLQLQQEEQHRLSLTIQHVNAKLDPVEDSLLKALDICESNCRLLDSWSNTNQDAMSNGVNNFVAALGAIYAAAGQLPPHYTANMTQLLSIDSGINPGFTLKNDVDQAQFNVDLNRGSMAQTEIFRDTFDSLVAEWIDNDDVDETKQKFLLQQQQQQQQQQQAQTQPPS